MLSRVAVLVAALGGCNWAFGLDAPSGTDAASDAATDAVRLDAPLGLWGPASAVSNHATAGVGEEDAFLDVGGRELYTIRRDPAVPTGVDIMVSLRNSTGEDWPAPLQVGALNTTVEDTTPRLSLDDLTIYLATNRATLDSDVWFATREGVGSEWHTPARLDDPAVNGLGNDRTLTECAGGRRVFSSDRLTTFDVFEEVGGVATPIAVASDPSITESGPFITRDCLTLYFSANHGVSTDLYVATRAAVELPFDPATIIDELSNDDRHESDAWVSADGRHILFSVSTLANPGGTDLYEAFR